MTEIYSTALDYLAHLEWPTIALIALFPALLLVLYIRHKKKKPETVADELTDGKKNTTNFTYFAQVGIFIFISAVSGIACFNFGYQRMGPEGGAIAVGVSLVLFCAYLRNSRKHSKIQTTIEYVLLIPFVAFEIIVIGANFITVGENKPNARAAEDRSDSKAEIVRLTNKLVYRPRSNTDKYDNRLIENAIAEEKENIKSLPVYRNSEKKFYEQAALLLDVDINIIELLFNISLGALLVIGGAITGTRINSYVCPYLIRQQLELQTEINGLLDSTEGLKKKPRNQSGLTTSAVGRGSGRSRAHAKDSNFEPNVQKMVNFLSKKTGGYKVTEKVIKQQTKATDKQVKLIRSQLKKLGWLSQGTNGNAAEYVKSTPGLQAVS